MHLPLLRTPFLHVALRYDLVSFHLTLQDSLEHLLQAGGGLHRVGQGAFLCMWISLLLASHIAKRPFPPMALLQHLVKNRPTMYMGVCVWTHFCSSELHISSFTGIPLSCSRSEILKFCGSSPPVPFKVILVSKITRKVKLFSLHIIFPYKF